MSLAVELEPLYAEAAKERQNLGVTLPEGSKGRALERAANRPELSVGLHEAEKGPHPEATRALARAVAAAGTTGCGEPAPPLWNDEDDCGCPWWCRWCLFLRQVRATA